MKKNDVVAALNKVREANSKWTRARLKYKADESVAMRRLVLEGAVALMSVEDIAAQSGMTARAIRLLLRAEGVDPRRSKPQMAKHAARTLGENAAILGVEPKEMDLMSPLAYLPMGSELKAFMSASVDADTLEAETSYDEAKARIEKALLMGIEAEEIYPLTGSVEGVAAWLASEGIK